MNTKKAPTVSLVCANCQCNFERKKYAHDKALRKNKNVVVTCSNECRIKHHNMSRRDDKSPFRRLWFRMKLKASRDKRKTVTVTLQDLKNQWDKQNGICPYTGYKMILPETSRSKVENPYWASVDRIDYTKGYAPDNIEFVCVSVNYAKNSFDRADVMAFFAGVNPSGSGRSI